MERDARSPDDPRVFLAVQRTFLAWTRTALALMGFGFVVARIGLFLHELSVSTGEQPDPALFTRPVTSLWLGVGLVLAGVAVQAMALLEYRQFLRRWQLGAPIIPERSSLPQLVGIALIVGGSVMAAYLFWLY